MKKKTLLLILFPIVWLWHLVQNLLVTSFSALPPIQVVVMIDVMILTLQLIALYNKNYPPILLIVYFITLAVPIRIPKSFQQSIVSTLLAAYIMYQYPEQLASYATLFVTPSLFYYGIILIALFHYRHTSTEVPVFKKVVPKVVEKPPIKTFVLLD